MRFDVEAEIAAQAARDEQLAADAALTAMVDTATERRLLAALLCDTAIDNTRRELHRCESCGQHEPLRPYPRVRALNLVDDLAVDDFSDYRHRAAFSALRNLQREHDPKGDGIPWPFIANDLAWRIAEAIEHADEARGTNLRHSVGLVFLVDLRDLEKPASVEWIRYAQARLRELAQIRRLA